MRAFNFGGVSLTAFLLMACVTVNIYFPSAQAQEAAEQIVEDILGEKAGTRPEQDGQEEAEGDGPSSSRQPPGKGVVDSLLSMLVPSAQAGQPDFSVNTPKIRSLQAQMKKRHRSLLQHYNSGAIGYTKDGLVAIRDPSRVSLKQRAGLNKLVAAENRDRNQLYQAIADANGRPEWQPEVRKVFAKTWEEKAERGWWFQARDGAWQQK